MPASSHGLPTSGMRDTGAPHFAQAIFTASMNGLCGEWPSNIVPALDGALLQLRLAADDLERAARLAVVDRQREAVVALLRDHPVVHVLQPVQLARQAEVRDPADLLRDVGDLVAQLVHADEPLVDQAEDELACRSASSAGSGARTAACGT